MISESFAKVAMVRGKKRAGIATIAESAKNAMAAVNVKQWIRFTAMAGSIPLKALFPVPPNVPTAADNRVTAGVAAASPDF